MIEISFLCDIINGNYILLGEIIWIGKIMNN